MRASRTPDAGRRADAGARRHDHGDGDARVTVLGGGSFGTALAQHLARRGHRVLLWTRRPAVAAAIAATRRNPAYLSDFALHPNLAATASLAEAAAHAAWIVVALPAQALRAGLVALAPHLGAQPLVLGAKGIEVDTLMTMDEVAADVLGRAAARRLVALSGPSFAREIMEEQPTAVVLACRQQALCERIAPRFFCDTFRAYCASDVTGVEMGGALKNVMAIAAGALAGMGLGENTRAALITRGIAEMSRLAVAKGGEALTLLGLAGVGDLVLTCTGGPSRNRAVGRALGEGLGVAAAVQSVQQVAEGVQTTASAYHLARRLGVDAPIVSAVYSVLFAGVPAREAMLTLARRAPGRELD